MSRTALITGASTGIGYELSKVFARDHHDLVLVARGEQKLQQVAQELKTQFGVSVKVIAADLARPESPSRIYSELEKEGRKVDFLVNNAGFGLGGFFHDTDLSVELEMIQVNVTALVHLTKLFLKDMRAQRYGKIMNVASTAGFLPGPLMSIYYATKAFVLSFSEAIANELQDTGVTVTALCPGPTRSEFHRRAKTQGSRLVQAKLLGFMEAAEVAEIGYAGFMKGKRLVIPGLMNKIVVQSIRLSPRKVVTQIARMLQER